MLKRDFFIQACNDKAYLRTAWNISCFALTRSNPDAWKSDPYPWRIVQLPNGYFFVDPNLKTLVQIDDAQVGQPLFRRREPIVVKVGEVANIYSDVRTSYANLLANYASLVYPFGGKIEFLGNRWNARKIEALLVPRWIDTYEDVTGQVISSVTHSKEQALEAPIYTKEVLAYFEGIFSLAAYTQCFTPADTRKTLTSPPDIVEVRNAEMAKIKGREHDRAAIGQVMAALAKHDKKYREGDRSSGFLISKKSQEVVRMKMYLMYGAETGLDDAVTVNPITRSLTEGWDLSRMPDYINALRAASFNRGKQTESGGEVFKDLLRAAANLRVTDDDCGSTEGLNFFSDKERDFIGFTAIEADGTNTKINKDNVGSYLGKHVKLRSPGMCRSTKTDYCRTCVGDRLAQNVAGLSIAVADAGSVFLSIFLAAGHSKGVQLQRLTFKDHHH